MFVTDGKELDQRQAVPSQYAFGHLGTDPLFIAKDLTFRPHSQSCRYSENRWH